MPPDVILFNIVRPDTYNELLIVVALFNIVKPDTNKDDECVVTHSIEKEMIPALP